jgi:putative N6-adenine-specific DNA methylase
MVLASGWDRRAPLLDPLCGSATIAIEAALLTRRIAPGLAAASREPRDFAFCHWPEFHSASWTQVVEQAHSLILPNAEAQIFASDRNAGAIRAARSNAQRAGVTDDVQLAVRDLAELQSPEPSGWLVTNPPYGVRAGSASDVREARAAIESLAGSRLREWTVAILQPDSWPLLQRSAEVFRTRNGGIPVRFCVRPAQPFTP